MPDGRVLEIDIRRLPGSGPKAHILAFRGDPSPSGRAGAARLEPPPRGGRQDRGRLPAPDRAGGDLHPCCSTLLDLTDSAFGFIGDVLYRPTGEPYVKVHHLTNIAWDDATERLYERHHSGGLEFSNLDTLFGATLRTKQPVIANDPASDIRRGGLPPGHPPLTAFLGVPLKIGDRLIGMIGVANRPGGYSAELLEWLSPILAAATALFHAYRVDTERLDAEAALTDARDAAVAASRAKSEFVATVSHDMRTPLHALLGLSEMLLHNGLDGDQLRAVRAIYDSATSLSALIGDVLDFSQIEAGRVTITDEPFGLRRVLDHVETLLRPQAAAKGLTLHVTVPEALPERYVGDAMRLQEVLVNLVANAVKFTETGGVHVLVADDRTRDRGPVPRKAMRAAVVCGSR
jgi:signal transduction histidine kinase